MVMTVVSTFTAVSTVETPVSAKPTIHRSGPGPGECTGPESGAYPVQPKAAGPEAVAKPDSTTRPPARNSQYERALSRGKAMSGAPTWRGMR
jgi:hypothetical protein